MFDCSTLLQALVENAIHHGLDTRVDAGCIDIEARVDTGRLIVAITDDRPGTEAETIADPERVGGGNTRQRLETLYGAAGRLALTRAARSRRMRDDRHPDDDLLRGDGN